MEPESGSPSAEEVRARLDVIVSSGAFRRAAVERRLLRFLVERALENDRSALEENAIAAAVFGRGDPSDPRIEAVMHMAANRVRKSLKRYYSGARRATVVIELPKDGYCPVFSTREPVKPLWTRPVFWGVLAAAVALLAVGAYRLLKGPPPRYYHSIAVLPFLNFVPREDTARLASVLPGDLSARLAKLRKIRVAPPDSRNVITKASELPGVANRLSVDAVLTGSVVSTNSRIGVVVQMFDSSGRPIWADIYLSSRILVPRLESDIVYGVSKVLATPIEP